MTVPPNAEVVVVARPQAHGRGRGNGGHGGGAKGGGVNGAPRSWVDEVELWGDDDFPVDDYDDRHPLHRNNMHHHRHNYAEDFVDKPAFPIPIFSGSTDVEEYLTWELKIDMLFRMHNYSNERKLLLVSNDLADYATHWWERFVRKRMERHELPIIFWEQMKQHFRAHFVLCHYKCSLV